MPIRRGKSLIARAITTAALISLLGLFVPPGISRAESGYTITIQEPAEGAQISEPFTLSGTATVPFENQLALRITATSSGEKLIEQGILVNGTPGQQGTFSLVVNYRVSAATPALIQVLYVSPKDGTILARGEVRVVLRKYDIAGVNPADDTSVAAVKFALADYAARTQTLTPIPDSVEDSTFNDNCLGLARPGETCTPGQVAGKLVKLSFGGQTFTYHVANNQARFNAVASAPVNQRGTAQGPKLLVGASAATGVKLFVPVKLAGPFEGLFFQRVDWENGTVTIRYGADNNPVDIVLVERAGNGTPAAAPGGETVQIGAGTVPVQVSGGRRSITWLIQTTLVTVSVPESIHNDALGALANSLALLGSTQPGQINLGDKGQFPRLTLNLQEPVRSAEMAREALMTLVKPTRTGSIISVQAKQFSDSCLGLGRPSEVCSATVTPGYIIGIADTELYRYHVAGNFVRFNRENSQLANKAGMDYASLDAVRAAVKFSVVAPTDASLAQLGAAVNMVNGMPEVLLLYRDIKTGGVLALREVASGTPSKSGASGQQITINGQSYDLVSNADGHTVRFVLESGGSLITLWASPEISVEDIAREANALA